MKFANVFSHLIPTTPQPRRCIVWSRGAGLFAGSIIAENGLTESAKTCATQAELQIWAQERGIDKDHYIVR